MTAVPPTPFAEALSHGCASLLAMEREVVSESDDGATVVYRETPQQREVRRAIEAGKTETRSLTQAEKETLQRARRNGR